MSIGLESCYTSSQEVYGRKILPLDRLVLGLDIGSSAVRAVAGSITPDGDLLIESTFEQPSEGIRSGTVVNIETAYKVISHIIEQVELKVGREVTSIITSVGGKHIEGIISQGVVGISAKDQEIRKEDIFRSMEVARAFEHPIDREILHTLVQDFTVDGRSGIKDPVDMLGHRLETKVMIVTGSVSISQNIRKCIQRAGFQVDSIILQQLASAEAVISQEEKEMGTLLIDIGGGVTNMIGFVRGAPCIVSGLNIGSDSVTSDLHYILNKPKTVAETIKCEYGSCFQPGVNPKETIIIPQIGGLPSIQMPKIELCKIIEPRMAEILGMLKNQLDKNSFKGGFGGGIILVGGGSCMQGTADLAAEIFNLPARIGYPQALPGLERAYIDPRFSTSIGLVMYEARRIQESRSLQTRSGKNRESKKGFSRSIKNFFETLF